jgi:hypothetical protein
MNAYITQGQARIQQRDIATILLTDRFMAAAALAAMERQRGWQAEAEVDWLLKQNALTPHDERLDDIARQQGAVGLRAGAYTRPTPWRSAWSAAISWFRQSHLETNGDTAAPSILPR